MQVEALPRLEVFWVAFSALSVLLHLSRRANANGTDEFVASEVDAPLISILSAGKGQSEV